MPDRPCTLTGSQEAVSQAKEMVQKIISRAQGMGDGMGMDGHMGGMNDTSRLEIMIPGNKVGLVIGKGGETIRQLQVKKCLLIPRILSLFLVTKQEQVSSRKSNCRKEREWKWWWFRTVTSHQRTTKPCVSREKLPNARWLAMFATKLCWFLGSCLCTRAKLTLRFVFQRAKDMVLDLITEKEIEVNVCMPSLLLVLFNCEHNLEPCLFLSTRKV